MDAVNIYFAFIMCQVLSPGFMSHQYSVASGRRHNTNKDIKQRILFYVLEPMDSLNVGRLGKVG